jgi:hypothetical protein
VDEEGLDAYDEYDECEDDPAWVTIDDATCKRETEKALLVEIKSGQDTAKMWFPKSHIAREIPVSHVGDAGHLICTKWIAQMKGVG